MKKKKKIKHWPTPLYNSAPSLAHHLCTFRAYLSTASGIQLLFYHPLCFMPCLGCTVPLSTTLNWWYNTKSLHQSPFIFFFNCVFFIYILTNFKRKKEQKKTKNTRTPLSQVHELRQTRLIGAVDFIYIYIPSSVGLKLRSFYYCLDLWKRVWHVPNPSLWRELLAAKIS